MANLEAGDVQDDVDGGGFAPPGDIHKVHNISDETAISLHVYGADIAALGTSVNQVFRQQVLTGAGPVRSWRDLS